MNKLTRTRQRRLPADSDRGIDASRHLRVVNKLKTQKSKHFPPFLLTSEGSSVDGGSDARPCSFPWDICREVNREKLYVSRARNPDLPASQTFFHVLRFTTRKGKLLEEVLLGPGYVDGCLMLKTKLALHNPSYSTRD